MEDEYRNLYFEDAQSNLTLVKEEVHEDDLLENMDNFLQEHYPDFDLQHAEVCEEKFNDWKISYGAKDTFFRWKNN